MEKATAKAREIGATVLATRIYYGEDYLAVKNWLDEDKRNTAVLFHSASYPYGQLLFREYPLQTTFDDPNPVFT